MSVSDLFTVLAISTGLVFFLAGTVGLLRFPDSLTGYRHLDAARYDETTERPTEGTVVDADDDLAELCGRLKVTGRKNCAVVFCEQHRETQEPPARVQRPSRPRILAQ